jgi:hypothetical protein
MRNIRRKPIVRVCAFPECEQIVVARVTYCHEHYKRVKQGVLKLLQAQRAKETAKKVGK